MTVTFPITVPNQNFQRLNIRNNTKVATSANVFSAVMQTYKWSGEMWVADVTLKPMQRVDAAAWNGFLVSLRGSYGTFLMGDPTAATPNGSALGTPVLTGFGQSGDLIETSGWVPDQVNVLKAGDYIQLGNHLHMVEADVDADSSGEAVLNIFPRLREYYGEDEEIITSNTQGIWRLFDSDYQIYDVDAGHIHQITFTAFEDVPPEFGD